MRRVKTGNLRGWACASHLNRFKFPGLVGLFSAPALVIVSDFIDYLMMGVHCDNFGVIGIRGIPFDGNFGIYRAGWELE